MAKKKDSQALFEVLSRSEDPRRSMHLPDWAKPKKPAEIQSTEPETTEEPASESSEAIKPAPTVPEDETSAPQADAAEQTAVEPVEEPIVEDQPEADADNASDNETEDMETEPLPLESAVETEEPETLEEPVSAAPADALEEVSTEPEAVVEPAPPAADWVSPTGRSEEPMLRVEEDRVVLSLNFLLAMAILSAVLVALVAAFVLGQATAPETIVELPAPAAPVAPVDDIELLPAVGAQDRPELAEPGQRSADRYYLIYEIVDGSAMDEAMRIVEFCQQRGLPAEIYEISYPRDQTKQLAIWSRLGFRSPQSPAALDHARNVEKIGQEYYKTHGTYDFAQRLSPDAELKPDFQPGTLDQPPEQE